MKCFIKNSENHIMKNKRRIFIAVLISVAVMCLGQEKPQPQPVVPWSQAEKKYITDPKGGKFRIIKANNLSSTRDEGIEFLDAAGKVIKSYKIRINMFLAYVCVQPYQIKAEHLIFNLIIRL